MTSLVLWDSTLESILLIVENHGLYQNQVFGLFDNRSYEPF